MKRCAMYTRERLMYVQTFWVQMLAFHELLRVCFCSMYRIVFINLRLHLFDLRLNTKIHELNFYLLTVAVILLVRECE